MSLRTEMEKPQVFLPELPPNVHDRMPPGCGSHLSSPLGHPQYLKTEGNTYYKVNTKSSHMYS